jgi:hypothetical protein
VSTEQLFAKSTVEAVPLDYGPDDVLEEMLVFGWRSDEDRQIETFCRLHAIAPSFTARQLDLAFHNSRNHVNRLRLYRGNKDAQRIVFDRIMALPSDTDVRRALLWDPSRWQPYMPEAWEADYLSLPGFIGRFVECYKHSSVPLPYFAWAAFSLLSATSKYNVYVQAGGQELLLNLYLFLVGGTATGKSYARECVEDILTRLNRKLNTQTTTPATADRPAITVTWERPDLWVNILPQEANHKAIITRLGEIRKIEMKALSRRGDDLVNTGQFADATGYLLVDEVAEHFGKSDWGVNQKIAAYTSMYGETTRGLSAIATGTTSYDHQAFSMMVCGATEWFRGAVSPTMMKGGFVDRCQFVYRPNTKRIYTAFNQPIIDPLQAEQLATDLVALAIAPSNLRRRVSISDDAAKTLSKLSESDFQRELDVRENLIPEPDDYHASAVRCEQTKIKLAALLAISDSIGTGAANEALVIRPVEVGDIELAHQVVVNEQPRFQEFLDLVEMEAPTDLFTWLWMEFVKNEWIPITEKSLLARLQKRPLMGITTKRQLQQRLQPLVSGGVLVRAQRITGRNGRKQVGYRSDQSFPWNQFLGKRF